MSKPASTPPAPEIPPAVLAEWWLPYADYLAKERRYSPYTLRNYRQAFEDFYRWLARSGMEKPFDELDSREVRDFVIEAQRRFGRRTLHNHVSGLRAFFKFWLAREKVKRNPFSAVPLPKLERRLPKFLTEEQMLAQQQKDEALQKEAAERQAMANLSLGPGCDNQVELCA